MSDEPTPGQRAYEAWWRARWPLDTPPHFTPYDALSHADQRAWDAAAQAVLVDTLAHWRLREAAVLPQVHAALRAWHVHGSGPALDTAMHALETWWACHQKAHTEAPL